MPRCLGSAARWASPVSARLRPDTCSTAVALAPKLDVHVPRGHNMAFAPHGEPVSQRPCPWCLHPYPWRPRPYPGPTAAHAATALFTVARSKSTIHTRWGPLVPGEAEKSCYFNFIPLYSHTGVGFKKIYLWSCLQKPMFGTNTASWVMTEQTLNF
jgi:hypothetical protein